MSFKLGNINIGELYVGSNKIAQAYLGSNLVYQASAPGPTPSFDEVTIGTQTWMAKNLAIDDGGEGIVQIDNVVIEDNINVGSQYFYSRDAAIRVADSINGWHLPTDSDIRTLISYCGGTTAGKALKSTYGWYNNGNGTDDYGFTMLPVGTINPDGNHISTRQSARIWTSSIWSRYNITYYCNYSWNEFKEGDVSTSSTSMFSVRLIKD